MKCHNEVRYRITYPYIKEEGILLDAEVNLLRQAIYELKTENEIIKSELCLKDNTYLWCK